LKKNATKKYLKDLIYVLIIFGIVTSNLITIIVLDNNVLSFLSAIATVSSIILGVVAIVYSFLSGFKLDIKIDDMQRSITELANTYRDCEKTLAKIEEYSESIKHFVPPENKAEIEEIENDISRLRRSLAITTEKMLFSDGS